MSLRFHAYNLVDECSIDILDICLEAGTPVAIRYEWQGKIISAPINHFNLTVENTND